jgi:hypothetical protein
MCSTQADNNSQKFQLGCGCQFPWCALPLKVKEIDFKKILSETGSGSYPVAGFAVSDIEALDFALRDSLT